VRKRASALPLMAAVSVGHLLLTKMIYIPREDFLSEPKKSFQEYLTNYRSLLIVIIRDHERDMALYRTTAEIHRREEKAFNVETWTNLANC